MAYQASDIKYFQSTNRLGGQITTTEIPLDQLHAVFDRVEKNGSLNGETEYRCIYVRNKNITDTLYNTILYLLEAPTSVDSKFYFGIGTAGINNTEQTIIDEKTPPVGINFVDALGIENALPVGDLTPDSYIAIWLKREIAPNTLAKQEDFAILRTEGEATS